jgi:small subunit ribosomal protein S18
MDADRDFGVSGGGPTGGDGGEQRFDKGPRRFQRRRQQTSLPDYIDWKDTDFLRRFVPERGKIMPRRISGISAKDQRRLTRAIKRARAMALLPFVGE